ncbi:MULTISPECIES: hypothetical protein [Agrobacterium]|uniref:hypothetical protein n=1 Tax=Agrobacterium TaxID=357 RepID=UPI0023018CE7|nr:MULTISPECIES: hypothetical protein [Agrobacterium]MDA5636811.1 hypothetical protein [Agrobacterium sp. ST15.13.013]MDA6998257.1 hypothetical protein [Agrobacterium salinitolerans]
MKKFTLNGQVGGFFTAHLLTSAVTGLFWTPCDPMKLGFASLLHRSVTRSRRKH